MQLEQEFKVEVVHLNEEGHRIKTHVGLYAKQPTKKEIVDLVEESRSENKELSKLKTQVMISEQFNVLKK